MLFMFMQICEQRPKPLRSTISLSGFAPPSKLVASLASAFASFWLQFAPKVPTCPLVMFKYCGQVQVMPISLSVLLSAALKRFIIIPLGRLNPLSSAQKSL